MRVTKAVAPVVDIKTRKTPGAAPEGASPDAWLRIGEALADPERRLAAEAALNALGIAVENRWAVSRVVPMLTDALASRRWDEIDAEFLKFVLRRLVEDHDAGLSESEGAGLDVPEYLVAGPMRDTSAAAKAGLDRLHRAMSRPPPKTGKKKASGKKRAVSNRETLQRVRLSAAVMVLDVLATVEAREPRKTNPTPADEALARWSRENPGRVPDELELMAEVVLPGVKPSGEYATTEYADTTHARPVAGRFAQLLLDEFREMVNPFIKAFQGNPWSKGPGDPLGLGRKLLQPPRGLSGALALTRRSRRRPS